jgi:hypothetical protein
VTCAGMDIQALYVRIAYNGCIMERSCMSVRIFNIQNCRTDFNYVYLKDMNQKWLFEYEFDLCGSRLNPTCTIRRRLREIRIKVCDFGIWIRYQNISL